MSKRFRVGDHVVILAGGGLADFVGSVGDVVDDQDRDGSVIMYRIRLDEPVLISGVGSVSDDLWSGDLLALACPRCNGRVMRMGRVANGIWPIEGEKGCEFCKPFPVRGHDAQADWDRVHGSQYDAESAAQAEFASFERMGQRMSAGMAGGDPDDSFDELSSPAGLADLAPEPELTRCVRCGEVITLGGLEAQGECPECGDPNSAAVNEAVANERGLPL